MHVKLAIKVGRGRLCIETDVHGSWLVVRGEKTNQEEGGSLQVGKISKVKTKGEVVLDPPSPNRFRVKSKPVAQRVFR